MRNKHLKYRVVLIKWHGKGRIWPKMAKKCWTNQNLAIWARKYLKQHFLAENDLKSCFLTQNCHKWPCFAPKCDILWKPPCMLNSLYSIIQQQLFKNITLQFQNDQTIIQFNVFKFMFESSKSAITIWSKLYALVFTPVPK